MSTPHRLAALAAALLAACGSGSSPSSPPPGPSGPEPERAAALALGAYHSCALGTEGRVKCWGKSTHGQNGDAWSTFTPDFFDTTLAAASAVAAGGVVTCVVVGGTVRCAGEGRYGQLGDGRTLSGPDPVLVQSITTAVSAVAGERHVCARLAGGAVRCWGSNFYGQLGSAAPGIGNLDTSLSTTPLDVVGLTSTTQLALAESHSCALLADGTIRCWGMNGFGQLGRGAGNYTDSIDPVPVASVAGATAVAAGGFHSCALLGSGAVVCWGASAQGQLGPNRPSPSSPEPRPVEGLSGVTAIAAGRTHTCAVVGGGAVRCWGANDAGQAGDPSFLGTSTPRAVPGVAGVTALAAGEHHTCALLGGGGVRCWGYNGQAGWPGGAIGLDPDVATSSATPVPVTF